jgi:alanine dehydrogenase
MNIGVPREHRQDEYRVGLTPAGVGLLTASGHQVSVETNAGLGAGFSDLDYQHAGGRIVYSAEEAYGRADLVFKVTRPTSEEIEVMRDGCILMGFLHLAVCRKETIHRLLTKKITAVAYELIQDADGSLPVQAPLSQAAGRMTPQVAATLLQNHHGGKGILLGGVPGVPPAEVVIIGAGYFGASAARAFLDSGASVYVLDKDLRRLQALDEAIGRNGRLITMVSHDFNVRKAVRFADVLVGAVLVHGERAPIVVSRAHVKSMKQRSVIMDISIDQGGCCETSRPTTHGTPTYIEENVIHYCVPNMTSIVARTATHAFNNAAWPFMQATANAGLRTAIEISPSLRHAVCTHDGAAINAAVAARGGVPEGSL